MLAFVQIFIRFMNAVALRVLSLHTWRLVTQVLKLYEDTLDKKKPEGAYELSEMLMFKNEMLEKKVVKRARVFKWRGWGIISCLGSIAKLSNCSLIHVNFWLTDAFIGNAIESSAR
jgi:hypothetical protein